MRFLVLGSVGRTTVEMAIFCRNALVELGHQAATAVYNDRRLSYRFPALLPFERWLCEWLLENTIRRQRPDCILAVKGDFLEPSLLRRIRRRSRIPLVNYWIDDPHTLEYSIQKSPHYDLFCTNAPSCVSAHMQAGCPKVVFVSFGYDRLVHRRLSVTAEETARFGSDISFSGTLTKDRLDVLSALRGFNLKIWSPARYTTVSGTNDISIHPVPVDCPVFGSITNEAVWADVMVKVCNCSRIVLNIHLQNAPTMRDFEATACGAFLLTDRVDGLEKFFDIGKEIVCFSSPEDLVDKVRYYLEHPEERSAIAERGYARTQRDHGYSARMSEIIEALRTQFSSGAESAPY